MPLIFTTSSISRALIALAAVLYLHPQDARAEEIARNAEPAAPTIEQQIQQSMQLSSLIISGRFQFRDRDSRFTHPRGETAFTPLIFTIDRTYKGEPPQSPLQLQIETYLPTTQSWLEWLRDWTSLKDLASEFASLEGSLASGAINRSQYGDRRARLRAKLLRSPEYRTSDLILVAVRSSPGLDDPVIRDADVPIEMGNSYVLMLFGSHPLDGEPMLAAFNFDIYTTAEFTAAMAATSR